MIPRKRILQHIAFWTAAGVFLVFFIGYKQSGFLFTLGFVFMLVPVAATTSYIFNYYLLPRLLFGKQYFKFGIYAGFTFVISLYMQAMVMLLAFIVMADYAIERMSPIGSNLILLGVANYFIIFISAIIYLIKRWSQPVQTEEEKIITVKSERKNVPLKVEDILYVESLNNYVKIHTDSQVVITKEKISSLQERLENQFLRIHRSYLVNRSHISSFNKESLSINDQSLPISRSYKKDVLAILEQ